MPRSSRASADWGASRCGVSSSSDATEDGRTGGSRWLRSLGEKDEAGGEALAQWMGVSRCESSKGRWGSTLTSL